MSAAPSLETLRARIRAIEGVAPVQRRRVPTGVEAIDAAIEGLPCPGLVEISGPPGTGRTRLALTLVAALTRDRRCVAWVVGPGPEGMPHPPTAAAMGVVLERLLLVRDAGGAGPGGGACPEVWAAEQILRSGCFSLVVISGLGAGRKPGWGHQWGRAAEHGRCTALALTERPVRQLPAEVRLSTAPLDGGPPQLRVLRDRGRVPGGATPLPWPEACRPWPG